jgi:hypothetical protein
VVALAHVSFEDEPDRRSAAKMLSGDEAQRIAANIAKLPGLLRERLLISEAIAPAHSRCPRRVGLGSNCGRIQARMSGGPERPGLGRPCWPAAAAPSAPGGLPALWVT